MAWIQENLSSMLVGIGLILLLALAVAATYRGKASKGGCGLGCSCCHGCARMQEHQTEDQVTDRA